VELPETADSEIHLLPRKTTTAIVDLEIITDKTTISSHRETTAIVVSEIILSKILNKHQEPTIVVSGTIVQIITEPKAHKTTAASLVRTTRIVQEVSDNLIILNSKTSSAICSFFV